MKSRWHWALGALTVPSLLAARAFADGEPSNHDDRATTFQAVEGPVRESVPGGTLMLAAYAFIWLVVFLYVWRLVRMQRAVSARLAALEKQVKGSGSP